MSDIIPNKIQNKKSILPPLPRVLRHPVSPKLKQIRDELSEMEIFNKKVPDNQNYACCGRGCSGCDIIA